MWQDYDKKINNILDLLLKDNNIAFPQTCPVCMKNSVHVFYYRYKSVEGRGGIWIWCSNCHHFMHAQVAVPIWWENTSLFELEDLTNYPDFLEKEADRLDSWVNERMRTVNLRF